MKLKGLKINILGDSITEGYGTDLRFDQMLAEETGAIIRNYGICGTRIAKNIVPSNPDYEWYFGMRIPEMDPDADAVVIFGGTNDFGHGDAPLGTMGDRTYDTFYGAMHAMLTDMINRYPTARIIVMTPLHRLFEERPTGDGFKPEGVIAPLKAYVDIIREVCEYYSIPVVDLWAESGLQPALEIIRETYMPDGLHPNRKGHRIIADMLRSALERL